MINIPESRLKHCYVVGKVMEYCAKRVGCNDRTQRQAFLVGYLHDSMYDYENGEKSHSEIVSECIDFYPVELKAHSVCSLTYRSNMLNWLYFADHIVNSNGDVVTFDDKLQDIEERHGCENEKYEESKRIVVLLRSSGFVPLEKECVEYFNKVF